MVRVRRQTSCIREQILERYSGNYLQYKTDNQSNSGDHDIVEVKVYKGPDGVTKS